MRFVFSTCLALAMASTSTLHAQAPATGAAPEPLLAQNRRQPTPAAVPTATPIPTTPAAKKKGLFQRVFGADEKKAEKPTPTAAAATPATPAATPAAATPRATPQKRRPEREEAPDKKPETGSKEAMSEVATKKATTSKTSKATAKEKEKEEESAPKETLTPEQQAVKDAEASGNPVAVEKAKYDEVKSRAVQDEKIIALKEKADAAASEEEGRQALRAYNKALFQKMRTLDSSIRERVDLMEDAVMKRLEPTSPAKK